MTMTPRFLSAGAESRVMQLGFGFEPQASVQYDWITPRFILDRLGEFDLDPCAHPQQPWPTARTMSALPVDGLSIEWKGRVWLNPPYGKETKFWLARMAKHDCGTVLIFARTDTHEWMRYIWGHASAILFLTGRLHFCEPDGTPSADNPGAPSALIAYGRNDADQLARCGLAGGFVEAPRVLYTQ